jgi:hypothetical protein
MLKFNFKSFKEFETIEVSRETNTFVDTIAIVVDVLECSTIVTRSTGTGETVAG